MWLPNAIDALRYLFDAMDSWPALHGQRKRGSISNDQLLISLAGGLKAHLKGWGVAVTMRASAHLTRIRSFLSRPWGLIRLGVWGVILILQPKKR